jgi:deoxyribonuclease-4
MMLLGCHVSVSGGYYRAIERGSKIGCTVVQIFTRNQLRWRSKPINKDQIEHFKSALAEDKNVKLVFAHGSYLPNLASPYRDIRKKSILAIKDELDRCDKLGLPYLVVHPGSHMGIGESKGIKNIVSSLKSILANNDGDCAICIETTAGQGTGLGARFEHIRDIIGGVDEKRVAACIDTCHIFTSGYDLRTKEKYLKTIARFHSVVGLEMLRVMHLNDSKGACGSRLDRHTHIGEGHIGVDAFGWILNDERLSGVPKVFETPKKKDGKEMDEVNLEILRKLIL